MKVIFAITSRGNDYYTTMTRIAVASIRLSNPLMHVIVACDPITDINVKRVNDPLISEVDQWLVIDTPSGDEGFRNRFVKTSLRSKVDGAFLFLDSDLFVRGDLSSIFNLQADIAGARNHSREILADQIWYQDQNALNNMEWEVSNEVYINGGVLFYNDTEGAKRFGTEWHRRWLESYDKLNSHRDQAALNYSIHCSKPNLFVLSDIYNAQIKVEPKVALSPIIWHYYSSAADIPQTSFELLANDVLTGKQLRLNSVKQIARAKHPWRRTTFIDDFMANRIIQRGQFDHYEAAWLRREFSQYVVQKMNSLSKRGWQKVSGRLKRIIGMS
jgi:hypothetical protein